MKKIVLFQPPYPHGGCQTYLSGGLMNLGSRLLRVGNEVTFFDLNHVEFDDAAVQIALQASDAIGFTVLGTPYIPIVCDLITRIRRQGYVQKILLGGEGIARRTSEQFTAATRHLGDVHQIKDDDGLRSALGGVLCGRLPSMEETSMVPMLERLTDDERRRYLTTEFCLYLSQGCGFNCTFCEAAKDRKEMYRLSQPFREEIEYIASYLASIGHRMVSVYLSNLDSFQTTSRLEHCVREAHVICARHGVTFEARCLSTIKSCATAARRDPMLLQRLRGYGLRTIAFGADGADEEVWKRENKRHNTLHELNHVLELTRQAGMTAEILMVVGFPDDRPRVLAKAVRLSIRQAVAGVVVRPYLGKASLHQDDWHHSERLRQHDYAMFASSATHPTKRQRWMANGAYAAIVLTTILVGR